MSNTTRQMPHTISMLIASLVLFGAAAIAAEADDSVRDGRIAWRAWLDSPGGELGFVLDTAILAPGPSGEVARAWIFNGEERISIPTVRMENDELVLRFDHYDSEIRARFNEDRNELDGEWTKTASGGSITRMGFHARIVNWSIRNDSQPGPDDGEVASFMRCFKPFGDSRWAVDFQSSEDPAVGLFFVHRTHDGGGGPVAVAARGTFMTTTGDYRFLAGHLERDTLILSAFDGAHAFLFKARVQDDGTLAGDFWSRDSWHETWTAKPDPNAALPDAFAQTTWAGGDADDTSADLEQLVFKDLDGRSRSVSEFRKPGRPMLIKVFGSWCPNCHDAAKYLVELDDKYGDRGLTILGLAFELTGEFQRDARQVRLFAAKHGIEFPLLLAGLADKDKATKSLAVLDRVRSFPTTIFIDGDGAVRSIHTGYTGPATGIAYKDMRAEYERLIDEMLVNRK